MRLSTLSLATVAAGAAGLSYAVLEARAFVIRQFTVPLLPPGSDPLRLLHVSDLHLLPRQKYKSTWLRELASLRPDLVVSTGDTLASRDAIPAALEAHGPLLKYRGVFVLGSNDYFAPQLKNPARYLLHEGGQRRLFGTSLPVHELTDGFQQAGWLNLTNRRELVKIGNQTVECVGVDDPHLRLDRYDRVAGPVDRSSAVTIGVAHAPYRRILDAMAADGVQLLLAGHTHGGQLCLPGVGTLVTNCDLDRRRAKGLSRWRVGGGPVWGDDPDAAWLHVSAGLGTSPFTPIRFACRPEASLLTLVAKSS